MWSSASRRLHGAKRETEAVAKPECFSLERDTRSCFAEWAALVEAATNVSAVPVTLDEGVNALAVAEAATSSANEERQLMPRPSSTDRASKAAAPKQLS